MLRALGRATSTTCYSAQVAQRRRVFFNLAKSSCTNASNESGTQSYHERKILPCVIVDYCSVIHLTGSRRYRRSELYEIIADVESYSNFVPYCAGSRILESKVSHDGITVMEAELTVGFLAFRESYVSTVTCKPHDSVEVCLIFCVTIYKRLTLGYARQ